MSNFDRSPQGTAPQQPAPQQPGPQPPAPAAEYDAARRPGTVTAAAFSHSSRPFWRFGGTIGAGYRRFR